MKGDRKHLLEAEQARYLDVLRLDEDLDAVLEYRVPLQGPQWKTLGSRCVGKRASERV